jgi:hypothetical protein
MDMKAFTVYRLDYICHVKEPVGVVLGQVAASTQGNLQYAVYTVYPDQ